MNKIKLLMFYFIFLIAWPFIMATRLIKNIILYIYFIFTGQLLMNTRPSKRELKPLPEALKMIESHISKGE